MRYTNDNEVWKLVEGVEKLVENNVEFEEIINYFDNALKQKPNDPYILYAKGGFYFDNNNYEEAIKYMDKVLEIEPRYVFALGLKSKILSLLGKIEESKICMDEAEKIKSEES